MVQANQTKSVFGFDSVGHFFASVLRDLQKASLFAEKVGVAAQTHEGTIEAITGLIPGAGSQAVVLERAAFSALGLVIAAVEATGTAASENGLSVTLDQAAVNAFRQLLAGCKGDLESLGYKI